MGAQRKTRRGKMLVEKQEWFGRLIAQGVGPSEACRIVGINRRTGARWRYGRTIRNSAGEPGPWSMGEWGFVQAVRRLAQPAVMR